jgi:hypothetical protein
VAVRHDLKGRAGKGRKGRECLGNLISVVASLNSPLICKIHENFGGLYEPMNPFKVKRMKREEIILSEISTKL